MNSNVMKMLPVVVLALSLTACGKDSQSVSEQQPATNQQDTIETTFQADCAGQTSALVAAAFDVTSCQLSAQQKALLRKVGPFSVEADCVRQAVTIKNAAGEISGEGAIQQDGTYNVALYPTADAFSALEGCAVKLEGTATGSVACSAEGKAENVTINTMFKFEDGQQRADAPVAALEFALANDPHQGHQGNVPLPKGKEPLPVPSPAPTKGPIVVPSPLPKDGKQPLPVPSPLPKDGKQPLPVPSPLPKDGKQPLPVPSPLPKDGKGPIVVPSPAPKGEQGKGPIVVPSPAPKGEQGKGHQGGGQHGGGHHGQVPAAPADACVSFAPCVFSSSAQLSCSSAQ